MYLGEYSGNTGLNNAFKLVGDITDDAILKGETGLQGATGADGAKGDTGLQGATGLQGETGLQGATGAAGVKGDTGLQGATGATGLQGDTGLQGATGAAGVKGDTGLQGATGATGAKGDTGATGAKGDAGSGLASVTYIPNSETYSGPTGTLYPMFKSTDNDVVYSHDTFTYQPSTSTLTVQKLSMSSDIKLKQNIKPLTYDYTKDLLLKLNPVEYTFINDVENSTRFGLIAQEVEESFKDVNLGLNYTQLDESGKENKYLSYLELIAPLIKVVNHLVDKVEKLELEIETMKNLI